MTKFELKLLTDYGYVPYGKDEEGYTTYLKQANNLILGIRTGWGMNPNIYLLRLKGPCYPEFTNCVGKIEERKKTLFFENLLDNTTDRHIEHYVKQIKTAAKEWELIKSVLDSMEDPFADKDSVLSGEEAE